MAVILRTTATLGGTGTEPYLLTAHWLPGTVGGSTADASAALATFRAFWNTLAAKIVTASSITYDPTCIAIEATTGVLTGAFVGTTPSPSAGAGGSSPLPLQTQGLIRWETAAVINGRRVRGRTFVPAPDEGDNTAAGAPSTSYTAQLASAVTAFLTPGATLNLPVVWHRPVNGSGGSHAAINGGSGRPYWAVQRKRR